MNESFKTLAMWADGDVTTEYSGKWWNQAFDAGENAWRNGAEFVELQTLRNGDVVDSKDLPHPVSI